MAGADGMGVEGLAAGEEAQVGEGLEKEGESVVVGRDACPAHLAVDKEGGCGGGWGVGAGEGHDEGVAGEDMGRAGKVVEEEAEGGGQEVEEVGGEDEAGEEERVGVEAEMEDGGEELVELGVGEWAG